MAGDWFLDGERKEYQEDAFKWLHKRFGWITQRINEQSEQQMSEAKSLMQYAAELRNRSLRATEHTLIFGVAVIAMIALAAAGLWIGVAGVALFLASKYWWGLYVEKLGYRLDRFRARFRELLEPATGTGLRASDMLPEDKEFVRKYADSILYPLAVASEKSYWYSPWDSDAKCLIRGRETPSASDLWHIETLYREYFHSLDHHHLEGQRQEKDLYLEWEKKHFEKCKLCKSARTVREQIEGALSKVEREVDEWRKNLVGRIDGNDSQGAICAKTLLKDYRSWESWHWPKEPETARDDKLRPWPLLKSLREKEQWRFEEADRVRELCRAGKREHDERAARIYDELTREMGGAAARCGLEEGWRHYDNLVPWLGEMHVSRVRRMLGRRKPEAMFRELSENSLLVNDITNSLKNYGADRELVKRELVAAKKLLAIEAGEWDRCYEKELEAAQGFALVERIVSERRYREHGVAAFPPPARRAYRAVRKLILKLS